MSRQWCVYFIKEYDGKNAPTKIGYTSNIVDRLQTIQTYNSKQIKLDCTIPCDSKGHAQKLERFLHRQLYHKCHLRGEWFNLFNVHLPPILDKFYSSHKKMFPDSEPLVLQKGKHLDYRNVLKENTKLKNRISELESDAKVKDSIRVCSLLSEIEVLKDRILELEDALSFSNL